MQHIAADRAKWRQVSETCAVNEPQEQAADIGGDDLLWRQAAALTRTADARAEDEDGLPRDNWRHKVGDEFDRITAVAIEEDHDVRVLAHGGDARLDRAPVPRSRLVNDMGTGTGCLIDRSVQRAAIDDDNFAHILRKHRGHDPCNCRFLIEAWNYCCDHGRARGSGQRRIVLARKIAHRLQRRPQLAQAADGLSESRALRNSRYAAPFQMSRKVCCVASPNV